MSEKKGSSYYKILASMLALVVLCTYIHIDVMMVYAANVDSEISEYNLLSIIDEDNSMSYDDSSEGNNTQNSIFTDINANGEELDFGIETEIFENEIEEIIIDATYSSACTPKHTADEAIAWIKSMKGQSYDIDGAYGTQCVDLVVGYFEYLGAKRPSGNAKDYISNDIPNNWQRIAGAIPQKGDVLIYAGNSSNPNGHVAIYEENNTIWHSRFNGVGKIQSTTSIQYNGFSNPYWGVIRPAWTPIIQFWGVNNGDWFTGDAEVWAKRSDNDSNHYADLYVDGTMVQRTYSDAGGYFKFTFNTRNYSNGAHTIKIVYANTSSAWDDTRSININNVAIDETPPVIVNSYVDSYDKDGYTVIAEVTDNIGVSKVVFPSWPLDESHEMVRYNGTNIGNNKWSCHINVSDLGGKEGTYITDIEAYDTSNNLSVGFVTNKRLARFIDRTAPSYENLIISQTRANEVTISVDAKDDSGIIVVKFPTWTSYNGQDDLDHDWVYGTGTDGRREGDTFTFTVKKVDHNFEWEDYITHIYIYDTYGNTTQLNAGHYNFENKYIPVAWAENEDHRYELYEEILTWNEAKAKCEELGGHLVTITSQEEQDVIASLEKYTDQEYLWIGANKRDGEFRWVTDEPMSYTNWKEEEPNEAIREDGATEDSAELYTFLSCQWNDSFNDRIKNRGFICEYEPSTGDDKDYDRPVIPKDYVCAQPTANIPTVDPIEPGTKVSLFSETRIANIYYTLDDSIGLNVDENNGILYEDAIEIKENTNIYAVSVSPNYKNSAVVKFSYTITDSNQSWDDIDNETRNDIGLDNISDVPRDLWLAGVTDVDYTGTAITFPDLKVYWYKTLLDPAKDYSVKYSNNTKAGKGTITITGKGNYSGTIKQSFKIRPLKLGENGINNSNLSAPDISFAPSNKVQKGTTTVSYLINGNYITLKSGKDFEYSYLPEYDYRSNGDHYINIIGKGNYTGTASFKEIISDEFKLISKLKFKKINDVEADIACTPKTPSVCITDDSYELQEGVDYILTYQNNCRPEKANIIVTGINEYSGSKVLTFKINALPISKATLATELTVKEYTGNPTSQTEYELIYADEQLVENRDYTVSYVNNTNAGKNKATIVFTGKNAFAGSMKKTYTIAPHKITASDVTPSEIGEIVYQKGNTVPSIIVKHGDKVLLEKKDYDINVSNNTAVNDGSNLDKMPTITITGKGNYIGTVEKTFTIANANLDETAIVATDITYKDKPGICKPVITLVDSNGVKLKAGTDYDKNIVYRYCRNTNIVSLANGQRTAITKGEKSRVDLKNDIIPIGAEIEATVKGINNYSGSIKTVKFWCVKGDLAKAKVVVQPQTYTGKPIELNKNDIVLTLNGTKLDKTDYAIMGYANNQHKGTATVILKGIGNYGGTKKVKFKIKSKSLNYSITYDANDEYMSYAPKATGTMKQSNIASFGRLAANTFKRNGYMFNGWNTSPDGTGVSYADKSLFLFTKPDYSVMTYGNSIKLYAQWR